MQPSASLDDQTALVTPQLLHDPKQPATKEGEVQIRRCSVPALGQSSHWQLLASRNGFFLANDEQDI
jgi:hypothetical protein